MRFQFSAAKSPVLRVIPEIADFTFCWLEGQNGIGKSLAVRLLQLATGDQPFLGLEPSWKSLKTHLRDASVTVSGLVGDMDLVVRFTPNLWLDSPHLPADRLGIATFGGKPITPTEAGRHLHVTRVSGDETVSDRFAAAVEADRNLVATTDGWAATWISRFVDLVAQVDQLVALPPSSSLSDLRASEEAAALQKRALESELMQVLPIVQAAEQLRDLRRAAAELDNDAPYLEAEIGSLETDLAQLEKRRQSLANRRDTLLPAVDKRKERLEELQKLSRRRDLQANKASDAVAEANRVLKDLGLPPDLNGITKKLEEARSTRVRLVRERADLELLPESVSLIRQLERPLSALLLAGMEEETIGVLADGTRVSARDLRDALGRRRDELSKQERFGRLRELEAQIADVTSLAGRIDAAAGSLKTAQEATQRLHDTETALARISRELDEKAGAEFKQVVLDLADIEKLRLAAIESRALARQQLAALERYGGRRELAEQIDVLTKQLEAAGGASGEASGRRYEELQTELETLNTEAFEIRARRAERLADVSRVSNALRHDAAAGWIRRWLPTLVPDDAADIETNERLVIELHQVLQHAGDLLGDMANDRARLVTALDQTRALIASGKASLPADLRGGIVSHYEARFGEYLSHAEVSKALFDDGEFVRVELPTLEVVWRDGSGVERRKPIEAFSSGERAFAFVLASILQEVAHPSERRLLVLDEFGAFIAADRLQRLRGFIIEKILADRLADQVVVILPLRRDLDPSNLRGYVMSSDDDGRLPLAG